MGAKLDRMKAATKRVAEADAVAVEPTAPPVPAAVVEAPPTAAKPGRWKRSERGRLPNGSRFEATYDAAAVMWSGVLIVPRLPDDPARQKPGKTAVKTFAAKCRGVWPLMGILDTHYRSWAAKKEKRMANKPA